MMEGIQKEPAVMRMEIRYKEAENPEEQKIIDMVKGIINDAFGTVGITKHEGDTYIGNGDGKDYVSFGKVGIDMMKSAAILSYVDTWLFYDEDGDIEDFGTKSKKDLGLLPPDAPDRSQHKEIKLSVMKMEIRYKKVTEPKDQRSLNNLIKVVDMIFADCGITKKDGNFYIGNDDKNDYAHFGMVFQALNDWNIFLESVDVWNFYDEYGEAEDFAARIKKEAGLS